MCFFAFVYNQKLYPPRYRIIMEEGNNPIRAMPNKWMIYTMVERKTRFQKDLNIPIAILDAAILEEKGVGDETNMMMSEMEKRRQRKTAPTTIEEYLFYEEDGWVHLCCLASEIKKYGEKIQDCWQLQRLIPHSTEDTTVFYAQKEEIIKGSDLKILSMLSGICMYLPSYINLNIIKLRKMTICGNSLLRGRNWAFPDRPAEIYLYWQVFETLNGWRLPVPLYYTRQAFSQWYLNRICPFDKIKYKWSMSLISQRKLQAEYCTFLDWTRQNKPFIYQDILKKGNDELAMGKIFTDYVRKNGYPKPSYYLIGSYRVQLSFKYFHTQFNEVSFDPKDNMVLVQKDQEIKLMKQLGTEHSKSLFVKVSEDFMAYSQRTQNLTIGNFKRIVGVQPVATQPVKKEDEIEQEQLMKVTRWNIDAARHASYEQVQDKIKHEDEMMRLTRNYRSKDLQRDPVVIQQDAAVQQQHWRLPYQGSPSSLHPEIVNFTSVNHRYYWGCPRCGKWIYRNMKQQHKCKPFGLNNEILKVRPRIASEPLSIELWREKNNHGNTLCVACFCIFTSRKSQPHRCDQKGEWYSTDPYLESVMCSLFPNKYHISFNPFSSFVYKPWKHIFSSVILHQQPTRQSMIYSQDISAYECEPVLQVTQMGLNPKKVHFVQTGTNDRGIVAVDTIPAGMSVGFVGGDIIKFEFAKFFRQNGTSFEAKIGHNSQNFCFAPVQHFTGLSLCKRTDNHPNCEIRFGIFDGKVRAYLYFVKQVSPGESIEIRRTMSCELTEELILVSSSGRILKEGQLEESDRIKPVAIEVQCSESEQEDVSKPISIDRQQLKKFRAE